MATVNDYQRRYLAQIRDTMYLLEREIEKKELKVNFEPSLGIESQLHQLSLAHTRYVAALELMND